MRYYLISYDIVDEKRLAKVRKIAYSYALSGQKSAVEAPLDMAALATLIDELKSEIDNESDKVNIIPFKGEPIILGKGSFLSLEEGVIVV
ncbi:MAG: CRISPR-associated endonuclease Cas2 [Hydrogenimonas sp.]|nr:CRISPR-associated endonuclease Cas2 [Hydrogenimonas sp.]